MNLGKHVEIGRESASRLWDHSAIQFVRVGRVRLYWCTTWFPGYQVTREALPIGRQGLQVLVMFAPGLALGVRI